MSVQVLDLCLSPGPITWGVEFSCLLVAWVVVLWPPACTSGGPFFPLFQLSHGAALSSPSPRAQGIIKCVCKLDFLKACSQVSYFLKILLKMSTDFDVFVSELDDGSDGTLKLSGHSSSVENISIFPHLLHMASKRRPGFLGDSPCKQPGWARSPRRQQHSSPGPGDKETVLVSHCPQGTGPRSSAVTLPGVGEGEVGVNTSATRASAFSMRHELSLQF